MRYLAHIHADIERWPATLRAELDERRGRLVWEKFAEAEATLRAWLQTRCDEVASEPVIVNRHHLTPATPQPTMLGGKWPSTTRYIGRPPMSAKTDDGWSWSWALHNPYPKDLYPDSLERFRLDLRRDLHAARARDAAPQGSDQRRRPIVRVDAIDMLIPRHALVCSCVDSPWTPHDPTPVGDPLPTSIKCHGHLIVMAWRARRKAAP